MQKFLTTLGLARVFTPLFQNMGQFLFNILVALLKIMLGN
jgi:hypothetical protein